MTKAYLSNKGQVASREVGPCGIHSIGGSGMPEEFASHMLGLAIGAALALQVVTSTLIGAALPLAAAKLRVDPAVVASPAITTMVDISGLFIFFTTAKPLLGLMFFFCTYWAASLAKGTKTRARIAGINSSQADVACLASVKRCWSSRCQNSNVY